MHFKIGEVIMNKLQKILLINSGSCLLFGVLFLIFPTQTSDFIGNSITWLVQLIGAALLFNGLHLIYASKRKNPICPEILYFILGDFLWVLGTLAFVLTGIVITSTQGIIVSLLIAVMVGFFGYMQVIGYKLTCQNA
jgi:hypothetical protein